VHSKELVVITATSNQRSASIPVIFTRSVRLDYGALEPGESDRWTFIACVPVNATMVRAQSELFDERSKESWDAIKVVLVPRSRPIYRTT
jgi:hypothetical protein